VISVLFETPSGFTPYGFAIFDYDAVKLTEPDAWQVIFLIVAPILLFFSQST
jgi:hypothetical protein